MVRLHKLCGLKSACMVKCKRGENADGIHHREGSRRKMGLQRDDHSEMVQGRQNFRFVYASEKRRTLADTEERGVPEEGQSKELICKKESVYYGREKVYIGICDHRGCPVCGDCAAASERRTVVDVQ